LSQTRFYYQEQETVYIITRRGCP